MKKLLFGIFMISVLNVKAQDWSTVYRQVDEVTLNEGLEEDYEKFESFWKILKQKHLKEGKILGWFVWKADKSSNNNNAWTDYIILNIYENEQKMKEMNSKTQEWWMNELKSAHKGKTKRSVVKKYIKETLDNKYKKKIEARISTIPMPAVEYIFLITLAVYYWILWFSKRKYFPDCKV